MKFFRAAILVALLFGLSSPSLVSAYYNAMPASVIIGQQDFTSGSANQGGSPAANTISGPEGVYYDPVSKKLFVADRGNHRVLIYNSIPTSNNASAAIVVGQQNFTSGSANQGGSANANTLNGPSAIVVVNGRLLIGDSINQRVLIYNSIPSSNNAAADVVIGQQNFTSVSANQGGTATARTLAINDSMGLASDGQKLFVADSNNHRALIYNTVPTANNAAADVVLGQTDFTTSTSNQGGIGASTLNTPVGILVANGKLLVGDLNNRVLVWNSIPTTNKAAADVAIGQPDFTSTVVPSPPFLSRRGTAMAFDGTRLFLASDFRNIVAIYNSIPTTHFAPWNIAVGVHGVITPLDAVHMWGPRGIAVGENKLIIGSKDGYNRVMIFNNVLGNPGISLDNTPQTRANNLIRLTGNSSTSSPYTMANVQYAINGGSFSYATPTDGAFDSVSEAFYFDFDPTSNQPRDTSGNLIGGYTAQVKGVNNNADVTDHLFYFSPFNVLGPDEVAFSASLNPTFNFSVNGQRTALRDNLAKYQILIRKTDGGDSSWQTLIDNIPVDFASVKSNAENLQSGTYQGLATNNGVYETSNFKATYSAESSAVQVYSKTTQLSGVYEWKIAAVDKAGHSQETPVRTLYVNSNPLGTFDVNFPLTVTNISGLGALNLSTYYPAGVKKSYGIGTTTPSFSGIAYAGSIITANFLDQACALKTPNLATCLKTTFTTTNTSSRFKLNVPKGLLTSGKKYATRFSVTLNQQYNQLPTFTLNITQPQ